MIRAAGIALALGAVVATASAQSAADHFAAGVRAYDELKFADAARHFELSVASTDTGLVGIARSQSLAYLGAAEWFQGQADSAAGTFRRLVLEDPAFHLDTLRFPPAVTTVFETLRRHTYAVQAEAPLTTDIPAGESRPIATLISSTPHRVTVRLARDSAGRALFEGVVKDSAQVSWDGRLAADGGPAPDGAYDLTVTSFDPSNRPVRDEHLVAVVWSDRPDTLPWPDPPSDARTMAPGGAAAPAPISAGPSRTLPLVWGLLSAAAAIALPRALIGDRWSPYGGVAAGAIGVVALGGVLRSSPAPQDAMPSRPVAAAPDTAAWRDRLAAVRRENARRIAHATVHVRVQQAAAKK